MRYFCMVVGFYLMLLSAFTVKSDSHRATPLSMEIELHDSNGQIRYLGLQNSCRSDLSNTGLLVMSEQGATLVASAYTVLYGENEGLKVWEQWKAERENKQRLLPPMLLMNSPDVDFRQQVETYYSYDNISKPRVSSSCIFERSEISSLDYKPVAIRMQLQYPDDELGWVNMGLECGGELHKTAIIATNAIGVRWLTRAYQVLFGDSDGSQVWQAWSLKQTPDALRLPSFVLVKDKDVMTDIYSDNADNFFIMNEPLPVTGSCGTGNHDPKNNQG